MTGLGYRALSNPSLRQLARQAIRQGFVLESTRKAHFRLYSPDGQRFLILPSSPSHPALARLRKQLHELGYVDAA